MKPCEASDTDYSHARIKSTYCLSSCIRPCFVYTAGLSAEPTNYLQDSIVWRIIRRKELWSEQFCPESQLNRICSIFPDRTPCERYSGPLAGQSDFLPTKVKQNIAEAVNGATKRHELMYIRSNLKSIENPTQYSVVNMPSVLY